MVRAHQEHRSAAERREQLLDVAIEVMREGGVAAASTRALTSRAGLQPSSFHYYFPSRDALISALVERELSGSVTQAWHAIAPAVDMRQGVAIALGAYLDRVRADPEYHLVIEELVIGALRSGQTAVIESQHAATLDRVSSLIHQWSQSRGAVLVVPVATLAQAVVGCATAVATSWLRSRDDRSAARQIELVAEALTLMFTPDPGTSGRTLPSSRPAGAGPGGSPSSRLRRSSSTIAHRGAGARPGRGRGVPPRASTR